MNKPVLLILASALALGGCNTGTKNAGQPAAAGTKSGIDFAAIDKSVKPGDDFDKYANGTWEKTAQIPPDKSNIGVFSIINDRAQERKAELIDGIVKSSPSAGSDDARIANFYNAYMDTGAIEKSGLSPLKTDLDRIEAIADKGALADAIGRTLRADADPINATNFHTENLFGIFVTQAFDDPSETVPYILQGGLGLPDRDYYVSSDPAMAKLRADYAPYVAKILTLAGFPNAQARAQRVVALETKIAQAHETLEASQDVTKADNPWKRADFDKRAPGVDWGRLLGAAQLGNQQDFVIWQPAAVTKMAALICSQPLDVWKDWLAFHRINQMTEVLPKAFDDANFAFFGTEITGTPQQLPRNKRAFNALDAWLGDAVGKR